MRRSPSPLPVAALVLCVCFVLALPPCADANVERHVLRYGPIHLAGYETVFPRARLRTPHVRGYVVRMHARLVDRAGRPVTIRDVMLHHIFFHRERAAPGRQPCAGTGGEPFYGTGEEDESLQLPTGYGYRVQASDRWTMRAMLMSHTVHAVTVYVQYDVRVEVTRRLIPVHAFWLRANGCGGGAGYYLDGTGVQGSTHDAAFHWTVPYDLRIVAAGGHLHGGAKDMWLSQPRCGDRRLLDNRPRYGMPDNLYYRARPVLHEPGPVDTRYFLSRTGIGVVRGEVLDLHGLYDAELPRAVMAVMHVYVARDRRAPPNCAPLPSDRRELVKPGPIRTDPPRVDMPLSAVDSSGHTYTITGVPWPATPLGAHPVINVSDAGFDPPHVTVPSPAVFTWQFTGALPHNVKLASGPRMIFTPALGAGHSWTSAVAVPGRYMLFCARHPMTMHAVVDVLPPSGS